MIAAIHGACVGGATNMVTFADIRYCTTDSWFQVKEAALGKLYIKYINILSSVWHNPGKF